jgi:antitoxin VapB
MRKRASRTTRAFKSGNSIAVRLPASFGVKPGTEMRVREEQGRYIVEPVANAATLAEDGAWARAVGSSPELTPLPREDFDDPPRPWHLLENSRDEE